MKRCLSIVKFFLFRDWFEDELCAFQGGKDGLMPCVWENEVSSFPQVLIIFSLLFDCLFVNSFFLLKLNGKTKGSMSILLAWEIVWQFYPFCPFHSN